MFVIKSTVAAIGVLVATSTIGSADVYMTANFSGNLGSAGNIQPPFNASGSGFGPGDPITGSFVFDVNKIPGAGVTNVFMSTFPDIGIIPNATAFQFNLDGISFNAGDNLTTEGPLAIQYSNGQFNGFTFVGDFAFGSSEYQLRIGGQNISVKLLDGVPNVFDPHGFPTGNSLMNATLNIGDVNLTNVQAFDPTAAVPGPTLGAGASSFALAALFLGWIVRRRRHQLG